MSGHADTIREAITRHYTKQQADNALAALDALLAENQRYEKALEEVKCRWPYQKLLAFVDEALAGDAE